MTKIHDLIPKQKQLSEITAVFRRCSYSFCLFGCLSRFVLFCSEIAQENAKNENKWKKCEKWCKLIVCQQNIFCNVEHFFTVVKNTQIERARRKKRKRSGDNLRFPYTAHSVFEQSDRGDCSRTIKSCYTYVYECANAIFGSRARQQSRVNEQKKIGRRTGTNR